MKKRIKILASIILFMAICICSHTIMATEEETLELQLRNLEGRLGNLWYMIDQSETDTYDTNSIDTARNNYNVQIADLQNQLTQVQTQEDKDSINTQLYYFNTKLNTLDTIANYTSQYESVYVQYEQLMTQNTANTNGGTPSVSASGGSFEAVKDKDDGSRTPDVASDMWCNDYGHFTTYAQSPYTGMTNDQIMSALESKYRGSYCEQTFPKARVTGNPVWRGTGSRVYDIEVAYILSNMNYKQYDTVTQWALWRTGFRNGNVPTSAMSRVPEYVASLPIYEEAMTYKEFNEAIKSGFNVVDKTNVNKLVTRVNQNNKTYTVGPYTVEYPYAYYNDVRFSGISNMYLLDENGKQIKVDKIILASTNKAVDPVYFDTSDDKNPRGENLYTDKNAKQNYPLPGETFYVQFSYGNCPTSKKVKLHIDYQYLKDTDGTYVQYEGVNQKITVDEGSYAGRHSHGSRRNPPRYKDNKYRAEANIGNGSTVAQGLHQPITMKRTQGKEKNETSAVSLLMDIGGYVWNDNQSGKMNDINGRDDNEPRFGGIEVFLHESGGSVVASTVTNSDGEYLFKDLNSQKKYYIEYRYDEQLYEHTIYQDDLSGGYSNATENSATRTDYNTKFAAIGSHPNSYKVTRPLYYSAGQYNIAYARQDIEDVYVNPNDPTKTLYAASSIGRTSADAVGSFNGYTLVRTGIYHDLIRASISSGSYSSAYSQMLSKHGNSQDTKSKLQYIEDTRISAYTGSNGDASIREYPIYNSFCISYSDKAVPRTINGVNYPPIYPGQYQIDFGIARREYFDLSLQNDVYKTTVTVNDKEHTYIYDDRNTKQQQKIKDYLTANPDVKQYLDANPDFKKYVESHQDLKDYAGSIDAALKTKVEAYQKILQYYWEIELRQGVATDNSYYTSSYNRELYKSDYDYKVSDYDNTRKNNADKSLNPTNDVYNSLAPKKNTEQDPELRVYVTYKITVRNQSQNGIGIIDEIANYFDKDYRLVENTEFGGQFRSYIGDANGNPIQDITWNDSSRYGAATEYSLPDYQGLRNGKETGKIYTTGLDNTKLTTGQQAYLYVTFEVRKVEIDGENWIRMDETTYKQQVNDTEGKENIAEINGYRSFYGQNTKVSGSSIYGSSMTDEQIINSNSLKASGIVDKDSKAGSVTTEDITKFEDDADKAPNIKIIIYKQGGIGVTREINGYTWEDSRVQNFLTEQNAIIGDGTRQNTETLINGITVQLVELKPEGEYIWREYKTGQNAKSTYIVGPTEKESDVAKGQYKFLAYMPGDYIIRFKYGDTYLTAKASNNDGNVLQSANEDSYNGQDYKSTTYQKSAGTYQALADTESIHNLANIYQEVAVNRADYATSEEYIKAVTEAKKKAYNEKGYLYSFDKVGYGSETDKLISDAKDIWSRRDEEIGNGYNTEGNAYYKSNRKEVMNYSATLRNHIGEVLASHENTPTYNGTNYNANEMEALYQELIRKTQMRAETGVIIIEPEYDSVETGGLTQGNNEYKQGYGQFVINNVDFGLQERPKAQLVIDKTIDHLTITKANGEKEIDSAVELLPNTNYLQWVPAYNNDSAMLKAHKEDIQLRNAGKKKPTTAYRSTYTDNGFGKLEIDPEIMYGATITITYKITVTNIGETDYLGGNFYYTGVVDTKDAIVTNASSLVVDYINNNMGYRQEDNGTTWKVINRKELQGVAAANGDNISLVNDKIKLDINNNSKAKNTKAIIITQSLNKALQPINETTKDKPDLYSTSTLLTVSKIVTKENTTQDMTYDNLTEIVELKDSVGRRQVYSVAGNQDPALDPTEIDTSKAETIIIVPPTGETRIYYGIAIGSALILLAGIVLIKKKVLPKK